MKEKRSHFRNMVGLAMVDGEFEENEKQLLVRKGLEMGLTESDVKAVLNAPDQVQFVVPKDPSSCVAQLQDLIMAMKVDGVIKDEEKLFIVRCAKRLGFRNDDLSRLLNESDS